MQEVYYITWRKFDGQYKTKLSNLADKVSPFTEKRKSSTIRCSKPMGEGAKVWLFYSTTHKLYCEDKKGNVIELHFQNTKAQAKAKPIPFDQLAGYTLQIKYWTPYKGK